MQLCANVFGIIPSPTIVSRPKRELSHLASGRLNKASRVQANQYSTLHTPSVTGVQWFPEVQLSQGNSDTEWGSVRQDYWALCYLPQQHEQGLVWSSVFITHCYDGGRIRWCRSGPHGSLPHLFPYQLYEKPSLCLHHV